MELEDLRDELSDEVSSILGTEFSISVTETNTVPKANDPAITFPNLDNYTQGSKLITTCVLYIDMRKSTDLSFAHKPQTVAKLYSAFVRAMTRTARHFGGHVRGIIGDRVMVLFDTKDCFKNAIHCAIAMNTVSQHIINQHFKANEVRFGIGIDHGRMLVTKAGIRRHGEEQGNYRNLVWLGRPANVASKLTDAANKPAEYVTVPEVRVAYDKPPQFSFGLGLGALSAGTGLLNIGTSPFFAAQQATAGEEWTWVNESLQEFVSKLEINYAPTRISHKRSDFGSFYLTDKEEKIRDATPAILLTAAVWTGFKKAMPDSTSVQKSLFKKVGVKVSGYSGDVFGGDAIYPQLKK